MIAHWVHFDSTWVRFDLTWINFDSTRVHFDLGMFWFGNILTVIPQRCNCQCKVMIAVFYFAFHISGCIYCIPRG